MVRPECGRARLGGGRRRACVHGACFAHGRGIARGLHGIVAE